MESKTNHIVSIFLNHLQQHREHIRTHMLADGVNARSASILRNAAAEAGIEFTPAETLECLKLIASGLQILDDANDAGG